MRTVLVQRMWSEGCGRQLVPVEDLQPIAEDSEMSKGLDDQDCQEDERVARLLAPLRSSVGHRFRELMRIHEQSPDTASGVHSGKGALDVGDGDQVILCGYAGDETGKTKERSLMIGLDAGGETAILCVLKLGEVVTTFRACGVRVETAEYENLSLKAISRSVACGVISTRVQTVYCMLPTAMIKNRSWMPTQSATN